MQHLTVTLSTVLFPQIDHEHNALWTSELHQVSVFMNLNPQENLSWQSKLSILQNAFKAIDVTSEKYKGSIVFMFD